MDTPTPLLIGKTADGRPVVLHPAMANRHGLVAGATGTGKTVTLQRLAQEFSRRGVPVFTADVKGDLAGLARPGVLTPRIQARVTQLGLDDFAPRACPALFWDLYGRRGHPARTTLSDMGPLLLGRLLDLNETQQFALQLAFKLADDQGLLLLDVKDLRALLAWMADHAGELRADYGHFAPATVGTIQRNLLTLAEAGGETFFGEPALRMADLMKQTAAGEGMVSVLDATTLVHDGRLYATFLLWLISELFETLDETGDRPLPRLVFFFDEAHLLFRDTPRVLVEKIEQVVRLIRSKGVGVYFVTQNPLDLPESVLGQLGNRIQHALRAFTPLDQKAVRAAAETFRANPALDTAQAITELEVGEALVSTLDEQGRPTVVERTLVAPPESQLGAITDAERADLVHQSPLAGIYDQAVDRESAYELLKKRAAAAAPPPAPAPAPQRPAAPRPPAAAPRSRQGVGETMMKSVVRSIGSSLGRQLVRGLLGSLLGGRR